MQRVLSVDSASIFILKSKPPQVGIVAEGKVPTSGWTDPSLDPWFYVLPPKDGIQDFDFVAEPPTGIVLQCISTVSTTTILPQDPDNYWGKGKPLKGVRIHARDNALEVMLDSKSTCEAHNLAAPMGGDGHPWPWNTLRALKAGGEDPFPLKRAFIGGTESASFGVSLVEWFLKGKTLRVYHTGDALTRDFRPDRANIELSPATERIVHVWFG
jgi:hypothetical protein